MKEKILIVEDEKKIARFLELELKYEGYKVEIAHDGRNGLEKALGEDIDLIVLDLMLPQLSGIEVCRRIRKHSDKTIIMLTAKDDISDKVTGLDSGADDYITKPFVIEELLATIRVALKRNNSYKANHNNILQTGKLKINKDQYKVTYNNDVINLSKTEFDLLYYLVKNKDIVLSRGND